MSETTWPCLQDNIDAILADCSQPLHALANGEVAAIIIRRAFPQSECASLIQHLIAEELMFDSDDERVSSHALPTDVVDQFTRQGLNPTASQRKRIDIGTSLGNLGGDQERFFKDAEQTHALFKRLFENRANPITTVYEALSALANGKQVITARESDGREYGPAIFRIHYGGYTYGPHFDSVRLREARSQYEVYKFEHQFAGVLCLQNATSEGVTAQGIIHRQRWYPELEAVLKGKRFYEYQQTNDIEHVQVDLEPGDLYFFNTGMIHEVPGVEGDLPRAVMATFIGYSDDQSEIMVWS
ncbi:MAG: hypothetical protein CMJ78_18840 [Planctomycetaceae bacterium]|nr:hypothetical protein [Planctomycetaceae bacterium]